MLLLICLILFIFIFILDYKIKQKKKQKETFKNHQTYSPKYYNDPNKLLKTKKTNFNNDVISADLQNINDQSKLINNVGYINKSRILTNNYTDEYDPIFKENENPIFSVPDNGLKSTVKFNPVAKNIEGKYKLYGDNLFTYQPAGKVRSECNKNIDQSTNNFIKDYINNDIIHEEPNQNQFIQDCKLYNSIINQTEQCNKLEQSSKVRTIKDIYDNLTNDNRMELQQNLDELEAYDDQDKYLIGDKYGASRFDTYSVK
jgi:hypothetical protein